MTPIESDIKYAIAEGLLYIFSLNIPQDQISLQPTKPEFEGYFTYVVFSITKQTGKSPEETGKLLGEYLIAHSPAISSYNVVKGFLNISLHDKVWLKLFEQIGNTSDYGQAEKY